jgi:vacuolar fusion protein MON1
VGRGRDSGRLLFSLLSGEFIKRVTLQRLEREGSLEAISNVIRSGDSVYSVSKLGIPGLRHFFYKSRSHVQVTGPEFEEPYEDLQERRR